MFDLDKIVSNISRFQKIEQKKRKEKSMKTPITKTITDKAPTLAEMQKFVGGYIEVVYAPNGDQIVLDEEGRLKDKEVNIEATEYWVDNIMLDVCEDNDVMRKCLKESLDKFLSKYKEGDE